VSISRLSHALLLLLCVPGVAAANGVLPPNGSWEREPFISWPTTAAFLIILAVGSYGLVTWARRAELPPERRLYLHLVMAGIMAGLLMVFGYLYHVGFYQETDYNGSADPPRAMVYFGQLLLLIVAAAAAVGLRPFGTTWRERFRNAPALGVIPLLGLLVLLVPLIDYALILTLDDYVLNFGPLLPLTAFVLAAIFAALGTLLLALKVPGTGAMLELVMGLALAISLSTLLYSDGPLGMEAAWPYAHPLVSSTAALFFLSLAVRLGGGRWSAVTVALWAMGLRLAGIVALAGTELDEWVTIGPPLFAPALVIDAWLHKRLAGIAPTARGSLVGGAAKAGAVAAAVYHVALLFWEPIWTEFSYLSVPDVLGHSPLGIAAGAAAAALAWRAGDYLERAADQTSAALHRVP
jgi:hypothetical protein